MFSKIGLPAKWCQECVSDHCGVPPVMGEKKRLHVNRFQFLFSWLAVFPLTYWLRESDFPGTGSSASSGRSRTHQHGRIKVFEKTVWVQILGFFPFSSLSPLSFPFLSSSSFFFFFFWLVICHVWSSALKRGSVAGGQVQLAPPPLASPGLQVAGHLVGYQIVRRVLLCAKSQTSVAPVQQLAKIIILSDNIFNFWPSLLLSPSHRAKRCEYALLKENTWSFFPRALLKQLILLMVENWTPQCMSRQFFSFKKKTQKTRLDKWPHLWHSKWNASVYSFTLPCSFLTELRKGSKLTYRIYPQGPNSSSLSRRASAEGSVGHPDGRVWDCRLCFRVCWQHDHLGVQPQLGSQETKMVFQRRDLCFLHNVA